MVAFVLMHHHLYVTSAQGTSVGSSSLIELRQGPNRRSVTGMWFFQDTPQIHLIIPLSAVPNHQTSSVTTDQVLLLYKSTLLTHMLQTFLLGFVWTAWLVRIGKNSWNALYHDTVHVDTAQEQLPDWPIVYPRYLTVNLTGKLSFLMLISLTHAIVAGTISPEYLWHTTFLVSKVISFSWTLFMNPQITQRAQDRVSTNTKDKFGHEVTIING